MVKRLFIPYVSRPIIKGIFHITLVHNKGIAFGLFKSLPSQIFLFISISAIILFFYLYIQMYKKPFIRLAFVLMCAGTLGNLIDRIRYTYIIDFLDFRVWPVFNVADICITSGAILLALTFIRETRQMVRKRIFD